MILEPKLLSINSASCTGTGDKLTYTVPAGIHAEVTGFGADETAGAGEVTLQLTPSGDSAINITAGTAADTGTIDIKIGGRIALGPGDKIAWSCTVAEGSAVWHLWISLLIYVAA